MSKDISLVPYTCLNPEEIVDELEIENDDLLVINENIEEKENHTFWEASVRILSSMLPATFGLLFIFILETINIVIIGKLNVPSLIASIGLGTLFVNATGYIPGCGLLGGIDTLCSHAFGQKNFKMIGNYTSIGRVVVIIFFLFFTVPMNFLSYSILRMVGIEHEIATLASKFCHSMSFSVFFALQFNTTLRYLQSMNFFGPGCLITLITAALHPFWCSTLVNIYGLGVVGAGLSLGITQCLNFSLITIYSSYYNPCEESHVPWFFNDYSLSKRHIWNYLKKAVPAAILFSADWIGFEILTFMASFLGSVSLASNVCLFNFISLIFMIQLGLSFAATTLVGNSVGANSKHNVKIYSYSSIIIGLVLVSITTSLVLYFREDIPNLYTNEPQVKSLLYDLIGIYVIFAIPDSIQIVLHGIIKGLGKQKAASIVCLIILYPFNITFAYILGFHLKIGVMGLWYSQLTSIFLLAFSYIIIYLNTDVDEVIKDSKHLIELRKSSEISGICLNRPQIE